MFQGNKNELLHRFSIYIELLLLRLSFYLHAPRGYFAQKNYTVSMRVANFKFYSIFTCVVINTMNFNVVADLCA